MVSIFVGLVRCLPLMLKADQFSPAADEPYPSEFYNPFAPSVLVFIPENAQYCK